MKGLSLEKIEEMVFEGITYEQTQEARECLMSKNIKKYEITEEQIVKIDSSGMLDGFRSNAIFYWLANNENTFWEELKLKTKKQKLNAKKAKKRVSNKIDKELATITKKDRYYRDCLFGWRFDSPFGYWCNPCEDPDQLAELITKNKFSKAQIEFALQSFKKLGDKSEDKDLYDYFKYWRYDYEDLQKWYEKNKDTFWSGQNG